MAATPKSEPEYTPEDVLRMEDGGVYEVVDGRLVEVDVGALSQLFASQLARLIWLFLGKDDATHVLSGEIGLTIFPWSPGRLRRAGLVVFRPGRLPADALARRFFETPPDLVAEVVSPNDTAQEVEVKVQEYLRAGVPLIWLLYPETRTIHVVRPDGRMTLLGADTNLRGEDALPGFEVRVAEIFRPPANSHACDSATPAAPP
ncbi:MAG: Uma2 family endonuclease [Hyphomicrobiales bacterium]